MPTEDAAIVYEFLAQRSSVLPDRVDLAVGFGHFDTRIADVCGALWDEDRTERIAFTGGVGPDARPGCRPTAAVLADHLLERHPDFPTDALLVEDRSNDTGENVALLRRLLAEAGWQPASIVLVATPHRQRRIGLTWRMAEPPAASTMVFHAPPVSTFEEDRELFARNGVDLIEQMAAEVDRIVDYGRRGWSIPEEVPGPVVAAAERLRS